MSVELFQMISQTSPGRITVAIQIEGGKVVVLFSEKTDRLEIEPEGAEIFAATLKHMAEMAQGK